MIYLVLIRIIHVFIQSLSSFLKRFVSIWHNERLELLWWLFVVNSGGIDRLCEVYYTIIQYNFERRWKVELNVWMKWRTDEIIFSALDRRQHFLLEMVTSLRGIGSLLILSLAFKYLQLFRLWFENSFMWFIIRKYPFDLRSSWKFQIKQSYSQAIPRSNDSQKSTQNIPISRFSFFMAI